MNQTRLMLAFVLVLAIGCNKSGPQASTTVGATVQGELVATDPPFRPFEPPGAPPDGSVYHDHTIMLTAGSPVTIIVRGGNRTNSPPNQTYRLDVYTYLLRNGVPVARNDDGAGNLNSRIIYTPTESGLYTIRVNTYAGGLKTGPYVLQTYAGALPTQT